MKELIIKVPAPFAGTPDLGFTTRYPAQHWGDALRDVPFLIEGPPAPMRKLRGRLSLFSQKKEFYDQNADGEAYTWTDLVPLSDELFVLAFRDRSQYAWQETSEAALAARNYFFNLIRPLVVPFLKDCVRIGQLRLADRIELAIESDARPLAEVVLARQQITRDNGTLVLWEY
jgi:hypothetical protein